MLYTDVAEQFKDQDHDPGESRILQEGKSSNIYSMISICGVPNAVLFLPPFSASHMNSYAP